MSGQAGSIGSIILGVVLVIASFYDGGSTLLPGIMLIVGGAVGLAFAPKSASMDQARAQQLQVATASTGFPIPVVFGEQKLTGNFGNYTQDQFRTVPIPAPSAGGKGSSAIDGISGYNYYLAYEYMLCLGPVDSINAVISQPGEVVMTGIDPSGLIFGDTDDYLEANIATKTEGGLIRIYRGNPDQTRIASGDPYFANGMNYRNICWTLFGPGGGFHLGGLPQAKSYGFLVRRLPKVLRDDGSSIDGFHTNCSDDGSSINFFQANPAAIIYEIMTNKFWGRGLSSDLFDEASFIAASQYFFDQGLGMSFTLDSAHGVNDLIDNIRQHLNTLLVLEGDVYKLRVLLDQSQTHGAIQTLTDDMVTNLSVQRPDWSSTYNELRAEFNNRERNYRSDIVTVQDLPNMQLNGGRINPQRIQLTGFTDFNIARRMAFRILTENSYPFATATFEANRFRSQTEIGDVVRIIWRNWDDSVATGYFMVLKMEEGASEDENIKYTCIESQLLQPVLGEETDTDIPDKQPWQRLPQYDEADINLFVPIGDNTDPVDPITAIETPAIRVAGAFSRILILGQPPRKSLAGINVFTVQSPYAMALDGNTFVNRGTIKYFAITGSLMTAIGDFGYWDRSAAGFEFSLTSFSLDESDLLGSANLVDQTSDNLETLIHANTCFMVIGEEILQIGKVDKIGTNHYRARNFIRGRFGTGIVRHAVAETFFYVTTLPEGIDSSTLTIGYYTDLKGYPVSNSGPVAVGDAFPLYHAEPENNRIYKGTSRAPLPPSLISLTGAGFVNIALRPRFYDQGAGTRPFIVAMQTLISSGVGSSSMSFQYQLDNGLVKSLTSFLFTPDDFDDKTAGSVNFTLTTGAADTLRIWSVINGRKSVNPLIILL